MVGSSFRTNIALSIVEVRMGLITVDRWWGFNSNGAITSRVIFRALMAFTVKVMLFVFRTDIASSIFILIFLYFRATAGIQVRIPSFGYGTVSTVSIFVNLVRM